MTQQNTTAQELNDLDLEMLTAGKDLLGGGGGGGGGGGASSGFDKLSKFQDFQARSFANAGVDPGSSAFGRLARRGVDLSPLGINSSRAAMYR